MKPNAKWGLRHAPILLSALALLLAVAALVGAPAAMARYAAMGTGKASVQVAGWHPEIQLGETEIRLSPDNTLADNKTKKQTFTVLNNSDVTADFTIMLEHLGGPHNEASFRLSPPTPVAPLSTGLPEILGFRNLKMGNSDSTVRLAPGETADFEIEFQYHQYQAQNDKIRTYSITCYAVQVD